MPWWDRPSQPEGEAVRPASVWLPEGGSRLVWSGQCRDSKSIWSRHFRSLLKTLSMASRQQHEMRPFDTHIHTQRRTNVACILSNGIDVVVLYCVVSCGVVAPSLLPFLYHQPAVCTDRLIHPSSCVDSRERRGRPAYSSVVWISPSRLLSFLSLSSVWHQHPSPQP